jgi:hypothetical protein
MISLEIVPLETMCLGWLSCYMFFGFPLPRLDASLLAAVDDSFATSFNAVHMRIAGTKNQGALKPMKYTQKYKASGLE